MITLQGGIVVHSVENDNNGLLCNEDVIIQVLYFYFILLYTLSGFVTLSTFETCVMEILISFSLELLVAVRLLFIDDRARDFSI